MSPKKNKLPYTEKENLKFLAMVLKVIQEIGKFELPQTNNVVFF